MSPARAYSLVRPNKSLALRFVTRFAPEYLELLREAQRANGWQRVAAGIADLRRRLNIDGYVALYDSERHLYGCFVAGVLDVQGMKELDAELLRLKPSELQDELEALNESIFETASEDLWPESEDDAKAFAVELQALPDSERAEQARRIQYFWCAAIAFFYNTVSVMVHGEKLTSLVPKALSGDRNAFLKAVHVDKALLQGHPRFKQRFEDAQINGDTDFLHGLSYRLAASPTRGKIRFPGLYITFAMLEMLGWLNDLRHEEILDLCDQAGLGRWQNRIEDVNYLTKQLLRYRRMQTSGGLSMR
jgi:hypothetical protein